MCWLGHVPPVPPATPGYGAGKYVYLSWLQAVFFSVGTCRNRIKNSSVCYMCAGASCSVPIYCV